MDTRYKVRSRVWLKRRPEFETINEKQSVVGSRVLCAEVVIATSIKHVLVLVILIVLLLLCSQAWAQYGVEPDQVDKWVENLRKV